MAAGSVRSFGSSSICPNETFCPTAGRYRQRKEFSPLRLFGEGIPFFRDPLTHMQELAKRFVGVRSVE